MEERRRNTTTTRRTQAERARRQEESIMERRELEGKKTNKVEAKMLETGRKFYVTMYGGIEGNSYGDAIAYTVVTGDNRNEFEPDDIVVNGIWMVEREPDYIYDGEEILGLDDLEKFKIEYEYEKGKTYALYDIYNGVEKIGEYGNWGDVIKAVKQRLADTGWECRLECREI